MHRNSGCTISPTLWQRREYTPKEIEKHFVSCSTLNYSSHLFPQTEKLQQRLGYTSIVYWKLCQVGQTYLCMYLLVTRKSVLCWCLHGMWELALFHLENETLLGPRNKALQEHFYMPCFCYTRKANTWKKELIAYFQMWILKKEQ